MNAATYTAIAPMTRVFRVEGPFDSNPWRKAIGARFHFEEKAWLIADPPQAVLDEARMHRCRFVEERNTSRVSWLERRRSGIGGSDVAALLGLDPYRSPLDLWLQKTGQVTSDWTDSEAASIGHALETPVAEMAAAKIGGTLVPISREELPFVHAEAPWRRCSPDFFIDVPGSRDLLSIKTVGWDRDEQWGEDGSSDVPPRALLQVQMEMHVTGCDRAWIAALIGGQGGMKLRVYRIEYDEAHDIALMETIDGWWQRYVVGGVQPPIEVSRKTNEMLNRWRERHGERIALAPPEFDAQVERLLEVKRQVAALYEEKDQIEARIKLAIPPDAAGLRSGTTGATATHKRVAEWTEFDGKAARDAGLIPDDVWKRFSKKRGGHHQFRVSGGKNDGE